MTNEILKAEPGTHELMQTGNDFMLGLNELKNRANMVTSIKKQIMHNGVHFGTVPGCGDKPTLLKNGAELLCMAFKLAPDAKVEISDLGNGHREYTVTTTLSSIVTGTPISTGLGSCSTMESKYRYRGKSLVNTGRPVPKEYWSTKDPSVLGGKGFRAKKDENGNWMIFAAGEDRVENPDIADTYNTVLKMASKRSLVDAVLKATGGSCEFTQDLEDMAPQQAEFADYTVQGEQTQSTASAPAPRRSAKAAPKAKATDEDFEAFKSVIVPLAQKNPQLYRMVMASHKYKDLETIPQEARSEFFKELNTAVNGTAAQPNQAAGNQQALWPEEGQ